MLTPPLIVLAAALCHTGNMQVCSALNRLHDGGAESSVTEELSKLLSASPPAENDLTKELQTRLTDRSDMTSWWSEVRIAGHLRLAGTAQVLADSLDIDTRDGEITGRYRMMHLLDDPAGQALVAIGQSAEPAVLHELTVGNRFGRFRAAYVLKLIGGPGAQDAFRQRYAKETDPGLKAFIGEQLGIERNPAEPGE